MSAVVGVRVMTMGWDGMGWEKREKDARRGVWFSCVNGYDYQTRGGVLNARRS
jgi:hypothetical protein|tara:strand:+ start:94 stop:252 length:159 start_codon:yes stop_codon:yes gene_type:complete